jgi:hypothetical protein
MDRILRSHTKKMAASHIYDVNINFDESIEAWNSNKKKLPNGMYVYICEKQPCQRKCHSILKYCYLHRNTK